MGFRQAAVLSSCSFFLGSFSHPYPSIPSADWTFISALLNLSPLTHFPPILMFCGFETSGFTFTGILFVCFNIDHRILWLKLSDENVQAAYEFYETFYNAPPAVKVSLEDFSY